jgi:DNA-directed RNA polymerase specialized sigma24 family protein
MNRSSEKALMHSVGCGDVRAMKHLMDEYLDLVSKTSFRILCDRKDSEAVTTDVFVHAWNYSERFDGSMPLRIWLLRLASRYSRLRVVRRRLMYLFGQRPDLFVTTAPKAAEYDDYVTKQAWELYCRASLRLSIRQRILFTLCVLEELSDDEASRITDIPRRVINGLLTTAEYRIRKELRRYGKSEEYESYVGFLRKVAEGFTEHDKLKRIIMSCLE